MQGGGNTCRGAPRSSQSRRRPCRVPATDPTASSCRDRCARSCGNSECAKCPFGAAHTASLGDVCLVPCSAARPRALRPSRTSALHAAANGRTGSTRTSGQPWRCFYSPLPHRRHVQRVKRQAGAVGEGGVGHVALARVYSAFCRKPLWAGSPKGRQPLFDKVFSAKPCGLRLACWKAGALQFLAQFDCALACLCNIRASLSR
jgi:hypothetical protein